MFSCEYCKMFNAFLQNFSSGCFCIILKVIKNLFLQRQFLKKCPCFDVLIIFSSQHFLERYNAQCIKRRTHLFSNLSSFPGFPNNSIKVYSIKLKTGMRYYMDNAFQNTIFQISDNAPLNFHQNYFHNSYCSTNVFILLNYL